MLVSNRVGDLKVLVAAAGHTGCGGRLSISDKVFDLSCSDWAYIQKSAGGIPGLEPGLTGCPPLRRLWHGWRYFSGMAGTSGFIEERSFDVLGGKRT